jgi:hypothetical protein
MEPRRSACFDRGSLDQVQGRGSDAVEFIVIVQAVRVTGHRWKRRIGEAKRDGHGGLPA